MNFALFKTNISLYYSFLMHTEFESSIFKCAMFMSIKASYSRDPSGAGFGGGMRSFERDDESSPEFDEDHYDISEEEREKTFEHLNDLVHELTQKLNEGTSSKTHKIPTPAPEKPGKRERVFKRGEWTLKPIPLETKAMADFVNDPLVPHAYLVKTA